MIDEILEYGIHVLCVYGSEDEKNKRVLSEILNTMRFEISQFVKIMEDDVKLGIEKLIIKEMDGCDHALHLENPMYLSHLLFSFYQKIL